VLSGGVGSGDDSFQSSLLKKENVNPKIFVDVEVDFLALVVTSCMLF